MVVFVILNNMLKLYSVGEVPYLMCNKEIKRDSLCVEDHRYM
jgi:hypothetical protein